MKKTSVMILAVLTVMVAGGVLFAHGEEDLEDVNMDFLPSPHYEYWHEYGFDTEDTFWRGMGFDEEHPPRVRDIVFYLYGYSVDINDFFDRMGHQERAEYSKKWKPVADAYLAAFPNAGDAYDPFIASTRYVYGVPDEASLTEEEAIAIASSVISEMGGTTTQQNFDHADILYDVTTPDQPLWKLLVYWVETAEGEKRFRVVLDAETGEVQEAFIVEGVGLFPACRY